MKTLMICILSIFILIGCATDIENNDKTALLTIQTQIHSPSSQTTWIPEQ
ncbi:hypothetical protein [Helicobacter sp. 13S00477-4]|nr:hypothetical protein [Helicobacter sp. 13S00477-4]